MQAFFIKKLWPDFTSSDLIKIINKYKKSKEILVEYDFIKFKKKTYYFYLFNYFTFYFYSNFLLTYFLIVLGTLSLVEFSNIVKDY